MNSVDYQDGIMAICQDGNEILEVEQGGESHLYLVDGFEPPIGGSVHTAPYMQFNGVLIDSFFINAIFNETSKGTYISQFNTRFKDKPRLSFRVSENHKWICYSR